MNHALLHSRNTRHRDPGGAIHRALHWDLGLSIDAGVRGGAGRPRGVARGGGLTSTRSESSRVVHDD